MKKLKPTNPPSQLQIQTSEDYLTEMDIKRAEIWKDTLVIVGPTRERVRWLGYDGKKHQLTVKSRFVNSKGKPNDYLTFNLTLSP